ncbi:unnamed protein product [Paramecium octaurelia]|uniref:Uncharacterized protein n=1 Tax=Paramecium octaurelia TaxID=43137 RepID=A0A8S1YD17_PAROT|nr:unnamed protein product [Paramecium octaurelia]
MMLFQNQVIQQNQVSNIVENHFDSKMLKKGNRFKSMLQLIFYTQ